MELKITTYDTWEISDEYMNSQLVSIAKFVEVDEDKIKIISEEDYNKKTSD